MYQGREITITGTIPGKQVIVKPLPVFIRRYPTYWVAIAEETGIAVEAPTRGEALAYLRREIPIVQRYLREDRKVVPAHMQADCTRILAKIATHIAPQGSPRSKKR